VFLVDACGVGGSGTIRKKELLHCVGAFVGVCHGWDDLLHLTQLTGLVAGSHGGTDALALLQVGAVVHEFEETLSLVVDEGRETNVISVGKGTPPRRAIANGVEGFKWVDR
jgi:hypothetical protein